MWEAILKRENISTGSKWEPILGYSRAVKVGDMVFVAGTTGADAEGKFAADAGDQTRQALKNILAGLEKAGAKAADVVRTRIFVTDISQWEAIGRAHGEVFGEVRPAMAMVEVSKLIDPAMQVEIEADAVITGLAV
jgi:enamine deaminase RidA (YjgF/YER057c/UK114 family)